MSSEQARISSPRWLPEESRPLWMTSLSLILAILLISTLSMFWAARMLVSATFWLTVHGWALMIVWLLLRPFQQCEQRLSD